MRLLLDTHALVWWVTSDRRLGERARKAIDAAQGFTWVSAASAWEAAIEFAAGRLRLTVSPGDVFSDVALHERGFHALPMSAAHALAAGALPHHHADPFDRMLIAQGQLEDLTIVTADPEFEAYAIPILDARG